MVRSITAATPLLIPTSIQVTFLGAVTKYLIRSNLKDKEFALAYNLKVTAMEARKVRT